MRILIPQFWFVKHIYKWKDRQVDPLGHCCRSSLRGIKVFVTFKNADYHGKIGTLIFASQPHIKMERLSSGHSRALLSQTLRKIKVFGTFKKSDIVVYFWKPNFCSSMTYKMERLSSGPSRALLSQFPSGPFFKMGTWFQNLTWFQKNKNCSLLFNKSS